MLTFEEALSLVKDKVAGVGISPCPETRPLDQVRARVLAEDVTADRDYPPFNRATRDGYAVRSSDVKTAPVSLECVGEARAGKPWPGTLKERAGACVEIMTGAPLPEGADAVAMIEHTRVDGRRVELLRVVSPYENVVRQGSEAQAGSAVLSRGRRLTAGEMGLRKWPSTTLHR